MSKIGAQFECSLLNIIKYLLIKLCKFDFIHRKVMSTDVDFNRLMSKLSTRLALRSLKCFCGYRTTSLDVGCLPASCSTHRVCMTLELFSQSVQWQMALKIQLTHRLGAKNKTQLLPTNDARMHSFKNHLINLLHFQVT